MKKLPFLLCILFASCTTMKSSIDLLGSERLKGKEYGDEVFIIKTDGEKISGSIFGYPKYSDRKVNYKIDDKKIPFKDIKAYQSPTRYTAVVMDEENKIRVGIDRIRRGKINLFIHTLLVGQSITEYHYHFYFNKGTGEIMQLHYKSFENAVGDNAEALDLLHSLFIKKKILYDRNSEVYGESGIRARLTKIVDLYN